MQRQTPGRLKACVARRHEILVVDDEPGIRLVMVGTLEDEGYSVRTAENGEQALVMCGQAPPDLMILDLNMPRMSGFRVLEALDERGWHRFPVLVVSGHRGAAGKLNGSVDAILMRPFDIDDLCLYVKRLLEAHEQQRGAHR